MDLYFSKEAPFCQWVMAKGHLHEPFVFFDVGCQGGINSNWSIFGNRLQVHAFDPIREVIDDLSTGHAGDNRYSFHHCALGPHDGEIEIFIETDRYQTSIYRSHTRDHYAAGRIRTVAMRSLDSLYADGQLPRPDFIKIDVESYEPQVIDGAKAILKDGGGVLGAEIETTFNFSANFRDSHFVEISDRLLPLGLGCRDLAFDRIVRPTFGQLLIEAGKAGGRDCNVGIVGTMNVLFARNFIDERNSPDHYQLWPERFPAPSADRVIKLAMLYELYGLPDMALEQLVAFKETLAPRFALDQVMPLFRAMAERYVAVARKVAPFWQRVNPEMMPMANEFNGWLLGENMTHGHPAWRDRFASLIERLLDKS